MRLLRVRERLRLPLSFPVAFDATRARRRTLSVARWVCVLRCEEERRSAERQREDNDFRFHNMLAVDRVHCCFSVLKSDRIVMSKGLNGKQRSFSTPKRGGAGGARDGGGNCLGAHIHRISPSVSWMNHKTAMLTMGRMGRMADGPMRPRTL